MKIGLFGYGKMGRVLERLAPAHGLEIVWNPNRAAVELRREYPAPARGVRVVGPC